jgi:hypothetical protein
MDSNYNQPVLGFVLFGPRVTMELPPSQGGFFIPGTLSGTRFAKVLSPGWKGHVTGGGGGRPGLRITGHG